jgi:predicted amidohydrolase
MELASLFPQEVYSNLHLQIESMQACLSAFLDLHCDLARRHHTYILAGTFPVQVGDGEYRNRAYLFSPSGASAFQEKLIMTRFEKERWGISAGREIKVFETGLGRIGVNVCYDIEFPSIARAQVEAGADLILVPSCTDTLAGYHRVRIGCRARALENQCYVVQSPTVGQARWSEAVDCNTGCAGLFTPVDSGFPDDGVQAVGNLDTPQWVYGELDPVRLRSVRDDGQVFNYRDWPRQFPIAAAQVNQVVL